MKNNIYYVLLIIISVLIASIVCILMFHLPIFTNVTVLMYRGILLILLSGFILVLFLSFILLLFRKKNKIVFYNAKDIFNIFVVFVCLNMMFFTLVPVTVERSVSVFTLSKISVASESTVTKGYVEDVFKNIYIDKNDAFGKRFDEQIVTGSIRKNDDGTYTLTDRGHLLVKIFKAIGKLYNADLKNLD